ncbi:MAG: FAD-dependent oxidoreductase [Gammaproteobacteria bacterium]|nr:FAD-dependent oxidoreductase [Gammaproteobacteria bacterium]MYC53695.1 FAD-dependent oxidoreductase [Gammaproteobacteria bacterium]
MKAGESNRIFDAVVIGGGPAGSAVSRLLARWGHSVVLLTRRPTGHPALAESVPPSARKLFTLLGIAPEIDDAGFFPARGNLVRWGDAPLRRADFAPGSIGHHVVRDVFDALLLDLAEEAGAEVRRDATVRRVVGTEAGREGEGEQLQRVEYEDWHGGTGVLRARFVVDCSGRTGVIANAGLRVHDQSNATIALAGVWRANAGASPAEPYTLVESYRDGWAWSMPVSDARRYLTMMIDPRRTELLKGQGHRRLYLAELEKTREARRLVADARLESDISGHTSSQYTASRFAEDGLLLVGDAGSFIDPLASAGVKKALASAWLAAVVVHTCISTPDMRDVALEFFDNRERATWLGHRRHTARYYREAAAAHGHGFWSARAAAAGDIEAPARPDAAQASALDPAAEVHVPVPTEPDIAALRKDPDVLRAFRELRAAPSIRLRPAPGLRHPRLPAVRGRRIVLDEHLASPALPDGVRFLRDVDLPPLVEMAGSFEQVPDLYQAYLDRVATVSLPDFLGALSVLLGKGMLTNEPQGGRR